jgi:hypothetical protein
MRNLKEVVQPLGNLADNPGRAQNVIVIESARAGHGVMKPQENHNGEAECQKGKESKANMQEQAQTPRQQEPDNKFERLVADLFDSYEPNGGLEEAAVVAMACALWKKRDRGQYGFDTYNLDKQIESALAQLSKSLSIRRGLSRQATGGMTSSRRTYSQVGRIQRPASPQKVAHSRSSKEALQLWAPPDVRNDLSPAQSPQYERDPLHDAIMAFRARRRSGV